MALTPPAPSPAPEVRALTCRGCGAPLELRAPGRSVMLACGACGAVLDAQDPDLAVIAKYEAATAITPVIPLGRRGRLQGEAWEAIGYLVRRTTIEGATYTWFEHLLWNPRHGHRWLTHYQGHWTLVQQATAVPTRRGTTCSYLGTEYQHFQTAQAEVAYVVGEFPWRVQAGTAAQVEDWICPPRILTCEREPGETTWSCGEYVDGAEIWKAFALPGRAPRPTGIGACQPSPFRAHARRVSWLLLSFVAAAVLVHLLFAVLSQRRVVLQEGFEHLSGASAAVTAPFELTGRRSNVRVDIQTDLANAWAYFHLALVDETTAQVREFGREVSYYFGRDSDGAWTEGVPWDTSYLGSVPAGRYRLVIEPESPVRRLTYSVRLQRDVPRPGYLLAATGLLVLPPLAFWFRSRRFEYRRWEESDHPWSGSSSDDPEDGEG